jgi:uncharacterized membrane protein (DUF2068 family)
MEMSHSNPHGPRALFWIGVFKVVKGTLLLIFAFGLLHMIHKDIAESARHIVNFLHFDSDNRHIAELLNKAGLITTKRLEELSGLTFLYSSIFLTEGVGLMLRKRWAEFLTVIASGGLIPVEIYALCKHVDVMKVILFAVNVAIVVYLIRVIRKPAEGKGKPPEGKATLAPKAASARREPAKERV